MTNPTPVLSKPVRERKCNLCSWSGTDLGLKIHRGMKHEGRKIKLSGRSVRSAWDAPPMTKETIISEIGRWVKYHKTLPRRIDWKFPCSYPSTSSVVRKFGTWTKALVAYSEKLEDSL